MKCKNCGAELKNGKCEYCGSVFDEDTTLFNKHTDAWIVETKDGDIVLDDAENISILKINCKECLELTTHKQIESAPLYLRKRDANGTHRIQIESLIHGVTGRMRIYLRGVEEVYV